MTFSHRVARRIKRLPTVALLLADGVGRRQAEEKSIGDAEEYWRGTDGERWRSNSHWRDGVPEHWDSVGREHLELFTKLSRVLDQPPRWGRVLEWGVGGGANAVAFAPHADEFVGVEIAERSLFECERQARAVCDTPFLGVLIDGDAPERALSEVGAGTCDVFLCLYVLELVPSPDYVRRLLRIARDLLTEGGVAFVQIKYSTAQRWRRRLQPKRAYARNLAEMTIYPLDEFWRDVEEIGLRPEAVFLVPKNELDGNYGYFLLSKPWGETGG